ncbi:hypothetical protein PInf_015337 [Phytophthora infestans]|nr:hypothetical protein PInf_015337 [Phytophthora infestans]
MDPHTSPISLDNIDDLFNLPASMALLGEEDFENTMMMLDSSALRREDSDNLDMAELSDAFNSKDPGSPLAANEQHATSEGGNSCLSPDLKVRIGGRTPVGGAVYIKQESDMPGYSPVMDSFLRESWDDIVGHGSRSGQPSLKPTSNCSSPFTISFTPGRVNPLPLNFLPPIPSPVGGQVFPKSMPYLTSSLPLPPATVRTVSNTSTSSSVSSASSTKSRSSRRAKQCIAEGCTRRAQSNNRCKTHGGGARCQVAGCDKSSQGGGLCRAHGGGKKCGVSGCTKGTQRLGLCYLHGGIRRCITEGCTKKDRGNGYCISHGGGRRCVAESCNRSVRKGNHCQMHQGVAEDTPFQISRGESLTSS